MQETNPQVQRRCLKNMNPKLPPLPSDRLVFIKIWLLWSEAVVWRKPQFHLGEKNGPYFLGINESYCSCACLESTVNTEARGWEADDEFAFPPELSASSKAWVFCQWKSHFLLCNLAIIRFNVSFFTQKKMLQNLLLRIPMINLLVAATEAPVQGPWRIDRSSGWIHHSRRSQFDAPWRQCSLHRSSPVN